MNLSPTLQQELNPLLEALCEERLDDAEFARFQQLLVEHPEARGYYLQYIDLHGALHWDTALAPDANDDPIAELVDATVLQLARPDTTPAPAEKTRLRSQPSREWLRRGIFAATACLILGVGVWIGSRTANSQMLASQPGPADSSLTTAAKTGPTTTNSPHTKHVSPHAFSSNDVQLASQGSPGDLGKAGTSQSHVEQPSVASEHADIAATERKTFVPVRSNTSGTSAGSSMTVLAFIQDQLQAGWKESGITPSPRADDAEWLRRLHLDLVGHIPTATEVERFLADRSRTKRAVEIDRLLDSPEFARHFATIWTDLLVGRAVRPEVNRPALAKFMRESFHNNRPWTEVVYDLVAAEGRTDQNGAANFLVAHLNNGAIPATGIISRLFLGTQLQCAQCHAHPFDDATQETFWAFNSFFQQAVVVKDEKYDPKTGRMIVAGIELATKASEGPVYFETRNGLMKVAYPQFGGTRVDPGSTTSRRRELARLMQSEGRGLAPAFVNRMWNQFHGRAFTPVVDDMVSRNIQPSHPALLDRLSEEFALSGYDVKQLVRWICNSESYQLTSRFADGNAKDNPEAGETPLFSHVYVKPMSAEQLYDSLVVATQGQLAGGPTLDQTDKTRDQWLRQFAMSFETEENDEATTMLDGSITQSLLMMNGDLVRDATSMQTGTWLHKLLASKKSETERIQSLFQSALSRPATPKELNAVKKLVKNGARHGSAETAYQDIYWALLNSNEFILNH